MKKPKKPRKGINYSQLSVLCNSIFDTIEHKETVYDYPVWEEQGKLFAVRVDKLIQFLSQFNDDDLIYDSGDSEENRYTIIRPLEGDTLDEKYKNQLEQYEADMKEWKAWKKAKLERELKELGD